MGAAQGKAISDLVFVLGKFGFVVSSDHLQFIFTSRDLFSDRLSPLILTLIQRDQEFYLWFINGETEAQIKWLFEVPGLIEALNSGCVEVA